MNKAVFFDLENVNYNSAAKESVWMLKKTGFLVLEMSAPQAWALTELAREQDLDLDQSWVVAHTLDGIEAGNKAGCKTVLIADGSETLWEVSFARQPLMLSPDLENAAGAVILRSIYEKLKAQWPQSFGSSSQPLPS